MRIQICDDDPGWLRLAPTIIWDWAETQHTPVTIETFDSPESLLEHQGPRPDVVFLDIELNAQRDGIQTAEEINRKWPKCLVVYLTNYLYYATEVYQTEHSYFVLKEQFPQKAPQVFDKLLHELAQWDRKLLLPGKGRTELALTPGEILYFERSGRVTRAVTVEETFEILEKIGDLAALLPSPEFARCHSSYLVYLPAIRRFSATDILMHNGQRLPISRSCRSQFQDAFAQWAAAQMTSI